MGSSWRGFVNSIEGYAGPMMLLIKHRYRDLYDHQDYGLIGAYIPGQLCDYANYQLDADTTLFTIYPKVRLLPAWRGKGGENYVYFNAKTIPHSIHKAGLGFGGNTFESWR